MVEESERGLCLMADAMDAYLSLPAALKAEVDRDVERGEVAALGEHLHVVEVLSARGAALCTSCEALLEGVPHSLLLENANGEQFVLVSATTLPSRPALQARARAPIAIGTLAAVVLLAAIFSWPIQALALIGAGLVLATRCLEPEEAWSAIDGNTLVLIFGMLAFGVGLDNAGTVELIVATLEPVFANASPLLLLIAIYALTSLLTESVTNNAVAVILTPIAIGLAGVTGADARELVVAVMLGASASFATPIGYQTNTLVYGAANYRFMDFVKIGLPMNVVVGIATCFAIDAFFG